jgi:hypothetical protein
MKLHWVGFGVLILATPVALYFFQRSYQPLEVEQSTYLKRIVHEQDRVLAPGRAVLVPFYCQRPVRMPSVPPDRSPYEEPEKRLDLSFSVSDGGSVSSWVVRESDRYNPETQDPELPPPEAVDFFTHKGVRTAMSVSRELPVHGVYYVLLSNDSKTQPVNVHLQLQMSYWLITSEGRRGR